MPLAADLRDNFTDNSVSTSAWTSQEVGSATVAETSGQIRFTLPSSTAGTHVARLTSRYAHTLTASSFYINIETMVATGVAATAFFQLYLNGANVLRWNQVSGTLTAQTIVAGVTTVQYSVAWNASTHKYLRITETGGNVLFQSSTNGTSWTTRATVAVTTLFPVTDLFVDFGASCGNIASPGSFRLDDVNIILPALSTTWRHTRALWALVVRNKRTQVACDTVGGLQGYLLTADEMDVSGEPSGSIRYWSGPAGGGRLLTEQTTQAAAEAMAVNVPTDGTFDLPEQIDARFFRLYHRSVDGTSNTLRELVPRRLVQAEDIEAESIRAINIAAGAITVDKLDVTLTITGRTFQTAYNGARVVLSGDTFGGFIGYGATDTYQPLTGAGTYQVLWSLEDGKFYAGGGAVILDSAGLALNNTSTALDPFAQVRFQQNGADRGYIGYYDDNVSSKTVMSSSGVASRDNLVAIESGPSSSSGTARAFLSAQFGPTIAYVRASYVNTVTTVDLNADTTNISGSVGIIAADPANVRLLIRGHDTTNTKYGLLVQDSAGATTFYVSNSGNVNVKSALLLNGTAVVGPRVTGWNAPTTGGGSILRGTFDTGATLLTTARTLAAVITDLRAHGLIGA